MNQDKTVVDKSSMKITNIKGAIRRHNLNNMQMNNEMTDVA